MLALILIDTFFFQRTAFTFQGDTGAGMLSLALTWITGSPSEFFHVPAVAFQQLSALIVLVTGAPTESLSLFHATGLGVQWLIGLAAAWWLANIAIQRGLSLFVTLLLGGVVASMPTIVIHQVIWSFYFPIGLLLVPVTLQLCMGFTRVDVDARSQFATLAVLGFLAANFYIAFTIVLALVIAAVVAHPNIASLRNRFPSPGRSVVLTCLQSVLVALAGVSLFGVFALTQSGAQSGTIIIAAVGVALVYCLLLLRNEALQSFTSATVLPLLTGWALGANALIPTWTRTALYAGRYKGNASPGYSAAQLAQHLNPWAFLVTHAWHFFLPLALVAAALLYRQKWTNDATRRFIPAFVIGAIVLNAIVAADVALAGTHADPSRFGQSTRYFLPSLAVIAVALVWMAGTGPMRIRRWMLAAFALICVASFADYLHTASIVTRERSTQAQIDSLIVSQLAENSGGTVYCARTVVPDGCALLYAYNNYRSYESIAKLNVTGIPRQRMEYASGVDEAVLKAKLAGTPALVISEGAEPLTAGLRTIWADKYLKVSVLNNAR